MSCGLFESQNHHFWILYLSLFATYDMCNTCDCLHGRSTPPPPTSTMHGVVQLHPLTRLSLILALFQYDSTFCVCTPLTELTNSREWFTVTCAATFGKVLTWLYVLHSSEWMIVPGATCCCIMGSKVAAFLWHVPQSLWVGGLHPKKPRSLILVDDHDDTAKQYQYPKYYHNPIIYTH